jgi:hypothetical protein
VLAGKIAALRLEAADRGLNQPCLRMLEYIEKKARIGKNMKKKAARGARRRRKFMQDLERGEWEDQAENLE